MITPFDLLTLSRSPSLKVALWNCIIKKTLHLAEDAMNDSEATVQVVRAHISFLLLRTPPLAIFHRFCFSFGWEGGISVPSSLRGREKGLLCEPL
jgi:hypothetical protein